jgi:imidazolonepropionase
MDLLIKNIKSLVQTEVVPKEKVSGKEMASIGIINDAFLLMRHGYIYDFGEMKSLPMEYLQNHNVINASGRFVFPSYCDSHTHIVYAGSRENEFVDRIRGLSYPEIATLGVGILNSAKVLCRTSDEELLNQSVKRLDEIISLGTGAVEIKSGYGLTVKDELRILRIIKKIKALSPLEIKSTFLGAHAIPEKYKNTKEKYINIVINEMLPVVASEELADFIDVFCDKGFFSPEDTERILLAGIKYGLRAKLHANELDYSGGIQTGVKYNALSVDHLEYTSDDDIKILLESETMPTLLPGSVFFSGLSLPPARRMIEAGLPVALASDYNPGSSPSGNMKIVMSLGCILLKMYPEEVINAVTINSAYAMGISSTHGSIARGKVANVFITKEIPSYNFMPYAFGSDLIETVILKGEIIK